MSNFPRAAILRCTSGVTKVRGDCYGGNHWIVDGVEFVFSHVDYAEAGGAFVYVQRAPAVTPLERPKGLDSGIAIAMEMNRKAAEQLALVPPEESLLRAQEADKAISEELDRRVQEQLALIQEAHAKMPWVHVPHDPEESTELERELFFTDPDVVAHVTAKCERPEKFREGLSIVYCRAIDQHEPEKGWLKRATLRMRAIMTLREAEDDPGDDT